MRKKSLLRKGGFQSQYSDPRWIKRSRQQLQDHPFCHSCKQAGKKLHAHHVNYKQGVPLWEAKDSELVTLCEDCHKAVHAAITEFRKAASFSNGVYATAIALRLNELLKLRGDVFVLTKLASML